MELMIKNLFKAYSTHQVFENLSLTFGSGVNYLIAPNGTGKSTLLRLITGIEQKDQGEISFNGKNIKFSDYGSYVPDKMTMYPFITGQEFIDLVCRAKNSSNSPINLCTMLSDLNVTQYLNTPFAKMSLGTQKKFFFIAGLIGGFSCLLLDEPSNAIDKRSMETIIDYLKQLSYERIILIATHDQHLQIQLPGRIFNLSSSTIKKFE